jgi:tetratricopeptide (TPR) repeat protein
MGQNRTSRIAPGNAASGGDYQLLNGWKDIAAFFGKDERTVKRWEKLRGMPVQRMPGTKGTVFADRHALAAWLNMRGTQPGLDVRVLARVHSGANGIWPRSPGEAHEPSAAARELYLEGTYLWQKRTRASLTEAVAILEKAVALDRGYALAHTALAISHKLAGEYGATTQKLGYIRALEAVERAIALDPALDQAQTVLANIEFFWLLQYDRALRRFEHARRLNPNSVLTRHWFAEALLYAGYPREALAEIDQAQHLDPQSRSIISAKAYILFALGNLDAAEQMMLKLASNEPDYQMAYKGLAYLYLARGDGARYLEFLGRLQSLHPSGAARDIVEAGRKGLSAGARSGMAEAMLSAARQHAETGEVPAYGLAHLFALNNDASGAAAHLQLALERYEGDVFDFIIDPAFKQVRTTPQFLKRVTQIGLPLVA